MGLERRNQYQAEHDLIGRTIVGVRLANASEGTFIHEIDFEDGSFLEISAGEPGGAPSRLPHEPHLSFCGSGCFRMSAHWPTGVAT